MPALSSAAPRPYRRSPRSVGVNGGLSQWASSPAGCTSWWAYSSTVGRPKRGLSGRDRRRGVPIATSRTWKPSPGEQLGDGAADRRTSGACSGAGRHSDPTRASRSARTEAAQPGGGRAGPLSWRSHGDGRPHFTPVSRPTRVSLAAPLRVHSRECERRCPMSVRSCRSLALLVVVLLSVVSCGGAGGGDESGPSFSPTRTPTRSPTLDPPARRAAPPGPRHRRRPRSRPRSHLTTRRAPPARHSRAESHHPPIPSRPEPSPTPTPTPKPTPSRSAMPEPSPTSSSPVPSESPTSTTSSPTASESSGEDAQSDPESATEDDETAAWMWWLLAAVLVVAAIAIPLLLTQATRCLASRAFRGRE